MKELEVNPKAKALIFDVDGTLVNSMPLHYKAWQKVAKKHGFVFPEDLFYKLAGVPTPGIAKVVVEKFRLTVDIQLLATEKEDAYVRMIKLVQPIQPVVELVRKYHNVLPMAAGTGSPKINANLTIKAINLDGFFKTVVSYEDVNCPKPAPDTFVKCAEILNVPTEFCQVFEDGDSGIEAAKRAGMMVTDVRPYINRLV